MFQFDQEEMEAIALRVEYAGELYRSGEDTAAVLSRLYCRFLPDTAPQQGDLMAVHVLDGSASSMRRRNTFWPLQAIRPKRSVRSGCGVSSWSFWGKCPCRSSAESSTPSLNDRLLDEPEMTSLAADQRNAM